MKQILNVQIKCLQCIRRCWVWWSDGHQNISPEGKNPPEKVDTFWKLNNSYQGSCFTATSSHGPNSIQHAISSHIGFNARTRCTVSSAIDAELFRNKYRIFIHCRLAAQPTQKYFMHHAHSFCPKWIAIQFIQCKTLQWSHKQRGCRCVCAFTKKFFQFSSLSFSIWSCVALSNRKFSTSTM